MTQKIHAHKMIADIAVNMANEIFEEAMRRNNELYRQVRKQNEELSLESCRKKYVREIAPTLVGEARATLSRMLGTSISEELKKNIHEALLMDAALSRGRNRAERRRMAALN